MQKIILNLVLLLNIYVCYAQEFSFKAKLESVSEAGYHKIKLPPEVTSLMNEDFGDVRIYTKEKEQVPYLLKKSKEIEISDQYNRLPIIEKKYNKRWDWNSLIYVENSNRRKINRLYLKINNFQSAKRLRLSGKNTPEEEYYVIKDHYILHEINNPEQTYGYKVLDFPLIDYKYLRLEIDDWHNEDRINILEVGYLDKSEIKGKDYFIIEGQVIQMDSSEVKQSYIIADFGKKHYVDRVNIEVDDKISFHRKAQLYYFSEQKNDTGYVLLKNFWLSSTQINEPNIEQIHTRRLKLVIDNKDDNPLRINTLDALEVEKSLIAKLQPSNEYEICFSNPKATAPIYDLAYFKNEIPDSISFASVFPDSILDIKSPSKEDPGSSWFSNPLYIWLSIALIFILLGYMAVKMLSEVNKRKEV